MQLEPRKELAPLENQAHISSSEEPGIMEEIVVEELSIDGICGVY